MVNPSIMVSIILDFEKAYNKVPHECLIQKLHFYGIRGNLQAWFRHFQTDRTQKVLSDHRHSGVASETRRTTSGVPQGTVTGPLFSLLYINDLPSKLVSRSTLFADDCVMYKTAKSVEELEPFQDDLANLETWQDERGMSFNAAKCFVVKISK